MTEHRGNFPPRRQAAAWLLCALVMLLAQLLGQWHRVAHGPQWSSDHVSTTASVSAEHLHGHTEATHAAHSPADEAATPWLERLFSTDDHASSCVIYDQLAHADGLPSLPIVGLPPAWVPATPPWQACWALAAQATGFLARGPPLIG